VTKKPAKGSARKAGEGEEKPVSWWQTVPGILTGVAALITAATGFVVALNQVNSHKGAEKPATAQEQGPAANVSSAKSPGQTATPGGAVSLPAGTEVKLDGGATVVKILSARLENFNSEKRALKFTVRHTNNGNRTVNFWSSSYRLIVDDVPLAPDNLLDELVAANSAKEGEVVFEVPIATTHVVLQISSGDEKTQIPYALK
jgi:hypothetical protein